MNFVSWMKVRLTLALLGEVALLGGGTLKAKIAAAETPAAPHGKLVKGKVLTVKVGEHNDKRADVSAGGRDGLRLGLFMTCKAKGYTAQVIDVQNDKCLTLTGGRIAVGDEVEVAVTAPEPQKDAPLRTPPAQLNPDLVNLSPNTWVKIRPNRNPVGRAFSGVCWGDGLIYYFGGNHGSHPCNDVELYTVAANTWTRATEAEDFRDADKWPHLTTPEEIRLAKVPGGGSNAPMGIPSPKGRPLVAHSYQQHAWFPEEQAFYYLDNKCGMWAFDPAKHEWCEVTRLVPPHGDQASMALVYDPGLKTVVAMTTTYGPAAYAYDRATRLWAKKCDFPWKLNSEIHTAYDSARKVHVVHAGRKCFTVDLAAGAAKLIKSIDEAVKAAGKLAPIGDISVGYDAETQRPLILNSDTANMPYKGSGAPVQLWAYDADKDDWFEVKMAGTMPTGDVRWGLLVYDPDHKCCLLPNVMGCGGGQGGHVAGLYAFRLKKLAK